MTITPKFKIGEIVYSITDPEQNARMVTGYTIRKNGLISYRQFEDFELSSEKIFR